VVDLIRIAKRFRWDSDEDARSMALYHRGYAHYRTGSGEVAEKHLDKTKKALEKLGTSAE